MSNILTCTNVTKKYGAFRALNDFSISIAPGKIVGLLGPNGSGKTTLIKMMNGLLTCTGGSIQIAGLPVGESTKALVSYLPDKNYLNGSQSVTNVLDFFEDFYEDFRRARATEMLGNLGIDLAMKLSTMSKGTLEKVQLVLVMSRDAKLYLLDEPIAGVDPAARDYILKTILQNYNNDSTIIISTHLIADIETILDEVIFIKNGELSLHASVDSIRQEQQMSVDALFREVFKC